MKVRNFYKSKTDLNQMNGIRQLLLPVLARFYQCEAEGTERIKESSLPLTTLLNCMETILETLYDQDYPELSVNGNEKCSDFGNKKCSIFGIKSTVFSVSAVQ